MHPHPQRSTIYRREKKEKSFYNMDIAMNIGVSSPPQCLEEGGCRVVIWMKGNVSFCQFRLPLQLQKILLFLSLPKRHSYGGSAPTASFAPWYDADRDRAWLASILARPGGHAGLPAPLADF